MKKTPITVAEMHAHFMALLAPLDRPDNPLVIHWVKRTDQAKACLEINEIWPPVIKSKITYATALHEAGHMLGRHRWSRYILTKERDAWGWAKVHALVWTGAMEIERVKAELWNEVQFKDGQFDRLGHKRRPHKIINPPRVAYYALHQDRRGRWNAIETPAQQHSGVKLRKETRR